MTEATSSRKKKELSGRRLLFVKALLADPQRRASVAYKAIYQVKSDAVAETAGCRLLRDVQVQEAIAEHDQKIAKKYEVKTEKVLNRLMTGVMFDIRKLYHLEGEKAGQLKLPHELDDEAAAAVVGTKYSKDGVFMGYQVIDVKGCSELIGKHLELFTERIKVSGTIDLATRIRNARKRTGGESANG